MNSAIASASTVTIPNKFHPPKSFSFPKRLFGSKNKKCSFRPEWCDRYSWVHYDAPKDAAFCYICMKVEGERKF